MVYCFQCLTQIWISWSTGACSACYLDGTVSHAHAAMASESGLPKLCSHAGPSMGLYSFRSLHGANGTRTVSALASMMAWQVNNFISCPSIVVAWLMANRGELSNIGTIQLMRSFHYNQVRHRRRLDVCSLSFIFVLFRFSLFGWQFCSGKWCPGDICLGMVVSTNRTLLPGRGENE